jgi:hypothetical protein
LKRKVSAVSDFDESLGASLPVVFSLLLGRRIVLHGHACVSIPWRVARNERNLMISVPNNSGVIPADEKAKLHKLVTQSALRHGIAYKAIRYSVQDRDYVSAVIMEPRSFDHPTRIVVGVSVQLVRDRGVWLVSVTVDYGPVKCSRAA